MHRSIEACISLIRRFSSKNKLIRLLKEVANRSLKYVMRKIRYIASIVFMQLRENLHIQFKMTSKDVSRLFCFRLVTGDYDFRVKTLQLLSQSVSA